MKIGNDAIAELRKKGFVIVEKFLAEEERGNVLRGFHRYHPPYDAWRKEVEAGARDPGQPPSYPDFPWKERSLNCLALHPDILDAAERITGTREIWISTAQLGMKYAGQKYWDAFHRDFGNNTLGPRPEPSDGIGVVSFLFFLEDIREGYAPILMVPYGRPDSEAVPAMVPGGSMVIYTIGVVHSASPFTAPAGDRPAVWSVISRKDRLWEGRRTTWNGDSLAMQQFIQEATPRQLEMIGFPPPGDPVWTERFLAGMAARYPKFDVARYRRARS